jgi:AAA+ ATPase superfamily predicted ATPase
MTLERVEIVRKMIPVTEKKSKRVVYRISGNFYRFWFRYIYPNKSFLEMGETGYVMEEIKRSFNAFVGLAFEDIATEFLCDKFRVGKWWYKDTEIDLVGLRKGKARLDGYVYDLRDFRNKKRESKQHLLPIL